MNTTTVSPTSISDPVAGPPKTEKSARAIIPSGGGTVRNMAARADFSVFGGPATGSGMEVGLTVVVFMSCSFFWWRGGYPPFHA